MLDRNLGPRTSFRSVRYRTNRQQAISTADPNASPKFRIKRNSLIDTTLTRTNQDNQLSINYTMNIRSNFQKPAYLQSFRSMFDTTSVKKQLPIHIDWQKQSRVFMPNFTQVQNSQFTTLDQIRKPLNFLKMKIQLSTKQKKQQQRQVSFIKTQLQLFKNTYVQQLTKYELQTREKLQNLRSVIRKNQINQQQLKLRTKRELEQLQNGHKDNAEYFQKLHKRSYDMQTTIFNCTPFELQQQESFVQETTYI